MLTLEQCKKLKELGFPQVVPANGYYYECHDGKAKMRQHTEIEYRSIGPNDGYDFYRIPTATEMQRWAAEKYERDISLVKSSHKQVWEASRLGPFTDSGEAIRALTERIEADTPEAALYALILKLAGGDDGR